MDNTKQINRDWTLRGDRSPRRKDVVIDENGIIGVVIKSEGDLRRRKLWVNNVNNDQIYIGEPFGTFKICNREQTSDFFIEYKTNMGWIKNRIYKIRGKDYPLQLIDLKYDLIKQDMLYVFKDLTSPVVKYVKTHSESLVENIPLWLHEIEHYDSLPTLDHEHRFKFKLAELINILESTAKISPSMIAINIHDNTLYIVEVEHYCGQPAIFNSKIAAAVALSVFGEQAWLSILHSQ